MIEKIKQLEVQSRKLEPEVALRSHWTQSAVAYANEYLDNLPGLNAFEPDGSNAANLDDFQIGEEGYPIETLIDLVKTAVDKPGINPASGGHLGYIPGGGVFPSALGDLMADVSNQYAGIHYASPGAVRMENNLLKWLCKLLGYPDQSLGNLTSGGSIASLIAITTAREAKNINLDNIRQSVVYLTDQVHHCIHKAFRIAGLKECIFRKVRMDDSYRMDFKHLSELIEQDRAKGLNPFMVVTSLGTTDTGAVDPIEKIADYCSKYDIWIHVDAAYGGFFALSDECAHFFKGLEKTDSLVIDPHKGLFLPYGSGAVLIKNGSSLYEAHYYAANYMKDAYEGQTTLNPADLSPELTKHFRGLRMWLPLMLYGLKPFRAAINEKVLLCRYFYRQVQDLGFEVGPHPDLSVCIYRHKPQTGDINDWNEKLVQAVQQKGEIFISSTTINGEVWLRLAVMCFRTHLPEIEKLLQILKEKVQELSESTV